MAKNYFSGMKVLVMGLGLNGGGLESARYLAGKGADITITDLKDEKTLAPSMEKLSSFPVRYVLGRHEMADFEKADMVIKNPGVRAGSPYLKAARRIETDISLFLAASPARLTAVTGSKGKSTVSTALYRALNERRGRENDGGKLPEKAWLGGNIGISPLGFLDELTEGDDVTLELSSWQLGDLKGRRKEKDGGKDGGPLLKPRAAVITAIMADHLDSYGTMDAYVADKRIIYQEQDREDATIAGDDHWGRSFLNESRGRPLMYAGAAPDKGAPPREASGWLEGRDGPGMVRLWEIRGSKKAAGTIVEAVPACPLVPGYHQKKNLLAAALVLLDLGLEPDFVRESLGSFRGLEHRLEFFHESGGVRFYNDSAATVPEAAAAAVETFEKPPVLVTGGTDKNLNFSSLARVAEKAKAVILLAGTGSEKLKTLLEGGGVPYGGPFDSLERAIKAALEKAVPGDTVVLSPGCASFGMFLNEFDRGDKWKEGVRTLAG